MTAIPPGLAALFLAGLLIAAPAGAQVLAPDLDDRIEIPASQHTENDPPLPEGFDTSPLVPDASTAEPSLHLQDIPFHLPVQQATDTTDLWERLRAGFRMPRQLSRIRMRLGDVLLLQGRPQDVKELERGNLFNIFGGVATERLRTSHAALAVVIFAAALAAIGLNLVPMPVAALGGAFLMMLTGCIAPEDAYRRVEWKVLILIGALLSLGAAMEATGTGRYLANLLIAFAGGESPLFLLTCFFVLTVALTQPMSNQAAAIVVVPVAFETARQLGLNPRSFAMMIAIAASYSYLTPLEPSSLMVYGPGRYRFIDFVKVGFPLTFLIYAVALLLVPILWPLR